MKDLIELYRSHSGKVSDKWEHYLYAYEKYFDEYKDKPVRLLEVGVQNGGSLEIWGKYFDKGKAFIGCDINPECSKLEFDDPRILVVIGDVNTDATEANIVARSPVYEIIIDDGSHNSSDIVRTFARFFKYLNNDGLFVVEDLHCSYWAEYEGGCYHPYSSVAFFKMLSDNLNFEHWGTDISRSQYIEGFAKHYGIDFDEEVLSSIYSVEFLNSLCFVRKRTADHNLLGKRFVVGLEEAVTPGLLELNNTNSKTSSQSKNPWFPKCDSMEALYKRTLDSVRDLELQIKKLEYDLYENDKMNIELRHSLSERDKQIAEFALSLIERDEKIADMKNEISARDLQLSTLYSSESWRLTLPLRFAFSQIKRVKRLTHLLIPAVIRGGGIKNTVRKALKIYNREGMQGVRQVLRIVELSQVQIENDEIDITYRLPLKFRADALLAPRVLLIAEMSIEQCKKYRVEQKHDMIEFLGIDCTTVNWHDTSGCIDALQTHSLVIFYRVPAYDSVLAIIHEAKRLRLTTIWEVDDLIFDREILENSRTLAALDKHTYNQLLEGAVLYRKAMLLCEIGIASTEGLAVAMKQAGANEVNVVENALDLNTIELSEKILDEAAIKSDSIIRIVYGSGTNTHNIDFLEAEDAIIHILENFPNVRLRIIGSLDLSEKFGIFGDRIERQPLCTYEEYLRTLAECDISIAPLEKYIFNNSKSNIKFIEASMVMLPSVCSPRPAFTGVIRHGINGYLSETVDEWKYVLVSLVEDKDKRIQIGNAAYLTVMERYAPHNIAKTQVAPLLKHFNRHTASIRVLAVNCYYSPLSFGGATIVAEELNKRLSAMNGFEIHVFTALPSTVVPNYNMKRYETDGINVFGVGLPDQMEERTQFENPDIIEAFGDVLKVIQPDIVHFHSIQGIGVAVVDICAEQGVPYVVTLHDTWWLCGRHFMINNHGKYCNQIKIDLNVCANCVENSHLNMYRSRRLINTLHNARLLLAPSRFMADLFIANGFVNVQINKNGIVRPTITQHMRQEKVTFGYVGGNTQIKGIHLIKKAFYKLNATNFKVKIVDNTLNLGFSSFHENDLKDIPNVEIVPAYTQRSIDEFFSNIDVLLFPTQWKESFGLTVREALARNVWVIATEAGGVVEDIVDGQNGFIIPFWDEGEALRKAIIRTLAHYEGIKAGDDITIATGKITYFEDQAVELATILEQVKLQGKSSAN